MKSWLLTTTKKKQKKERPGPSKNFLKHEHLWLRHISNFRMLFGIKKCLAHSFFFFNTEVSFAFISTFSFELVPKP